MPLPPGLDIGAIRRAIDYLERELAEFVEICFEQANVFSAIVGILGTRALDAVSNYEKHRHADKPSSVSRISSAAGRARTPRQRSPWRARAANALGQSNRIMTMPAGTSSGVTSLTRRSRRNAGSR